jgi:pimeloyl-ACP methyl ester carboxylesterase
MILLILAAMTLGTGAGQAPIERKTCRAPDGVEIVYSAAGAGRTSLVFVHGGMADRTFYDGQLRAFAPKYRVLAVDLGGHGESGSNRRDWGLPTLGADIKAAADAERLDRVILFGNSLGGPVVIEAARLLEGRVLGVVGIDTFHDLGTAYEGEQARVRDAFLRQRADGFRTDHHGAMRTMIKMLFHADADPALVQRTEERMLKTPAAVAYAVLSGMAGYDGSRPARALKVPIRTINGDLFPIDVAAIRRAIPGFDAVVMKHTGHYPMLEKPEAFNAHVAAIVTALDRQGVGEPGRPGPRGPE